MSPEEVDETRTFRLGVDLQINDAAAVIDELTGIEMQLIFGIVLANARRQDTGSRSPCRFEFPCKAEVVHDFLEELIDSLLGHGFYEG